MKKATSKFFFFPCRLLNYFVHWTIPRYLIFLVLFYYFQIKHLNQVLSFLSFFTFGLLRFLLQSLNLCSYDFWNCTI